MRHSLFVVLSTLLLAGVASAAGPAVNVSGRLVDGAGQPPPDGTATMQFLFGRLDTNQTFVQVGGAPSLPVTLSQGYFSVDVPLPPRDQFGTPPTLLQLRYNGDQMNIPLTTVPFAMQAERAPVWVHVSLGDLTAGSPDCINWVLPTNGNQYGIRTLGYLDPKDGGCASSTQVNPALSLSGSVLVPPTKPTTAVVQLKLGNMVTTPPLPTVSFRLKWELRQLSKTGPCVGPDVDFPPLQSGTPDTSLSSNIARTVAVTVDLTKCPLPNTYPDPYPGGDSFRFQLQRTDSNQAWPFEVEALALEFR